MKTKRKMSRYALARRLHAMALQIAAGKPVRIGSEFVSIPSQIMFEEEFETESGMKEIEIEIYWPSSVGRSLLKTPSNTKRNKSAGKRQ